MSVKAVRISIQIAYDVMLLDVPLATRHIKSFGIVQATTARIALHLDILAIFAMKLLDAHVLEYTWRV